MNVIVALIAIVSAYAFPIYPDKSITPGVIAPVTKDQVCKIGYTKDARHVSKITRVEVMKRYSLDPKDLPLYEIDHFVSLELGGANDIENLWPQAWENIVNGENLGARQKDVCETALHRCVCINKISLTDAQNIIKNEWVNCYHKTKLKQLCPNK